MKISSWHKMMGDEVEWYMGLSEYDRVYMSRVFDDTYSSDWDEPFNTKEIFKGGTGYHQYCELPPGIEHIMPDYSLYGIENKAYGFLTRGCPRACPFCIVAEKEGRMSRKVANLSEFWNGQKEIILLDPNILACKEHLELLQQLADSGAWVDFTQGLDARLLTMENIEALNKVKMKNIHFAWDLMEQSDSVLRGLSLYAKYGKIQSDRRRVVYVLTNYNTTHEDDLHRVDMLQTLGYEPYVMIFDKPNAPKETRKLQRWANNKWIYHSCTFEEYDTRIRSK